MGDGQMRKRDGEDEDDHAGGDTGGSGSKR